MHCKSDALPIWPESPARVRGVWAASKTTNATLFRRTFIILSATLAGLLPLLAAPCNAEPEVRFEADTLLPSEYFFYGEDRIVAESSPEVAFNDNKGVAVWNLSVRNRGIAWAYTVDGGATWHRGMELARLDERTDSYSGPPCVVAAGGDTFFIVAKYNRDPAITTPDQFLGPFGIVSIAFEEDVAVAGDWSVIPYSRGVRFGELLRAYRLPVSGDIILTYTEVQESMAGVVTTQVRLVTIRDGTWSGSAPLSGVTSQGGRFVIGNNEEVYGFWKDVPSANVVVRKSEDGGRTFGAETTVGAMVDNYTRVPGYPYNADPIFLPIEDSEETTLNLPSVAIDRSQGANRGTLYAVWTDCVTGMIGEASSTVGQREPNNTLPTATPIEVGVDVTGNLVTSDYSGHDAVDYYSFVGERGRTLWIDGLVTAGGGPYPRFGAPLHLQSCLDGRGYGQSLATKQSGIFRWKQLPPLLVTLPSDGIYVFDLSTRPDNYSYRCRVRYLNPDPNSVARDSRDVVLVASRDGGVTWSPRVLVNDDPPWFDNYLPEVEVDDLGVVHVVWFDRRNDPACGQNYDVFWTCSMDGCRTFLPSRQVNDAPNAVDVPLENVPDDGRDFRTGPRFGYYLDLAPGGSGGGIYASWPQNEPLRTFTTFEDATDHDIHGRRIVVTPDVAVRDLVVFGNGGEVELAWRVEAPDFVWKFEVVREGPGVDGDMVGTVDARIANQATYQFTDNVGDSGGQFKYRIRTVRSDGISFLSDPVPVSIPAVPGAPAIRPLAPNPSGGPIEFVVDSPAVPDATVRVFNAQGAQVRLIYRGPLSIGVSRFGWDGRNETGGLVPAGMYFVIVRAGSSESSRKFIRLQP